MKTVCLLFVCFLAATSMSIRDQRLKAMRSITYTSMFTEIQTMITTGGPLTSILAVIEKFDKQIRTEQAEHDAMWAVQSADCEDEKVFRAQEIKDGNESFKRASKHFNTCSGSLDKATVDLGNCKKDIVDSASALAQVTAIREAERAKFVAQRDRHEFALTVIADAIDFLDAMVSGEASLLELSQHTMQFITVGTHTHMMSSYAPLITLFAQMAASEEDEFVDPSAVDRCKAMMEEIMATCRANMEELQASEDASQTTFNGIEANLQATLRELGSLEDRLVEHVDDMNRCVLEEDLVMTQATQKVARNTEMLDICNAMCASFQHEWETATEQRNEERDLLNIIKQLAEKRMVKYRDAQAPSGALDGVAAADRLVHEDAARVSTSDEWE